MSWRHWQIEIWTQNFWNYSIDIPRKGNHNFKGIDQTRGSGDERCGWKVDVRLGSQNETDYGAPGAWLQTGLHDDLGRWVRHRVDQVMASHVLHLSRPVELDHEIRKGNRGHEDRQKQSQKVWEVDERTNQLNCHDSTRQTRRQH